MFAFLTDDGHETITILSKLNGTILNKTIKQVDPKCIILPNIAQTITSSIDHLNCINTNQHYPNYYHWHSLIGQTHFRATTKQLPTRKTTKQQNNHNNNNYSPQPQLNERNPQTILRVSVSMGQNFSSEPVVDKETERDHNDVFNVAVSSCQGWRMSQEDNHTLMLDLPGEHKAAFFAVYDGHGSARVSKHASESLWMHLTENEMYQKGQFKEALESAFLTFDREVNESYNAQLAGTTAVCVLIVDNVIYCANIGDSRAVASVNCECIPLSHDHKPENPQELKRIIAAGGYVLGNRVNGNLALSRAFGDFHYKGNDLLPPEQQIVSPCPDVKTIELNDDVDFIVLACDGIWDVLSSEEVVSFVISGLERNIEPGLICEHLTTRCLATDYELVIGCDNMTVLLVCYTRGRSWSDYCTDIFNKNSKKLGTPRTRIFDDDYDEDDDGGDEKTTKVVGKSKLWNIEKNERRNEQHQQSRSGVTENDDDQGDLTLDSFLASRLVSITEMVQRADSSSSTSGETPPITEVPPDQDHIQEEEEEAKVVEVVERPTAKEDEAPAGGSQPKQPAEENAKDGKQEEPESKAMANEGAAATTDSVNSELEKPSPDEADEGKKQRQELDQTVESTVAVGAVATAAAGKAATEEEPKNTDSTQQTNT